MESKNNVGQELKGQLELGKKNSSAFKAKKKSGGGNFSQKR